MFYTALKMIRHNGDAAPIPIDIYDDPLETAGVHLGGMTVRGLYEVSSQRPTRVEERAVQLEIDLSKPGEWVVELPRDAEPSPASL